MNQLADVSPATEPRALLVGGAAVGSAEQQPVLYPFDGREIATVCLADDQQVEQALGTAEAAEAQMAALPPFRRGEILGGAARLVAERRDLLARQMTLETGLALRESLVEAERTAEVFALAGEEARRISAAGEVVPIDAVARGEGRIGFTKRFPIGVVLGITPFNAPLVLVVHKLAPAFAAGCPCIVKPAPQAPLSALSLGQIMVEAGAPPGAISVVPTTNERAERMVRDPRVKMLSFTGSDRAGWHLKSITAARRVTLELGGNGAVIVHEDADLGHAAARCSVGAFLRAGQACNSVQRLYVHDSVFDEFQRRLLSEITKIEVGDPLEESTTIGGVIDETAAERALALIDEARDAGATILAGGTREGGLIAPTVLADAAESLRVCAEEAFAPIAVLQRYRDVRAVIDRVNASPFGLQAGLFTNDMRVINQAFESLELGALIVNDVNGFRVDQMPYGGAKRSGLGREGIGHAIREMTEERLLVIDPR